MKSYKIIQSSSYNREGEVLCYVSSKRKAVEYIKSCLGILVNNNSQKWFCKNGDIFKYNDVRYLTAKEILKWKYFGKTAFDIYRVEEIEIL